MHYHVSIFTLINAFNPRASNALRDRGATQEASLRSCCSTTNYSRDHTNPSTVIGSVQTGQSRASVWLRGSAGDGWLMVLVLILDAAVEREVERRGCRSFLRVRWLTWASLQPHWLYNPARLGTGWESAGSRRDNAMRKLHNNTHTHTHTHTHTVAVLSCNLDCCSKKAGNQWESKDGAELVLVHDVSDRRWLPRTRWAPLSPNQEAFKSTKSLSLQSNTHRPAGFGSSHQEIRGN